MRKPRIGEKSKTVRIGRRWRKHGSRIAKGTVAVFGEFQRLCFDESIERKEEKIMCVFLAFATSLCCCYIYLGVYEFWLEGMKKPSYSSYFSLDASNPSI